MSGELQEPCGPHRCMIPKREAGVCPHPLCPNGTDAARLVEPDAGWQKATATWQRPAPATLVRVIAGGHWAWGEPADRLPCRNCDQEIAKDGQGCPRFASATAAIWESGLRFHCVPGDCDPYGDLEVQEAMGMEMARRRGDLKTKDPCGTCGDAKALHIAEIGSCVARSGLPNECECKKWVAGPRTGSCVEHCCQLHGCKYGRADCPIENGTVEQDRPCEDCGKPDLNGWPGPTPTAKGAECGRCENIDVTYFGRVRECNRCQLVEQRPEDGWALVRPEGLGKPKNGTYIFRCERCPNQPPDKPPPSVDSCQWEVQRHGDVETTWACDTHLGAVIVAFQRDGRMDKFTVTRREDVVPF